MNAKKIMGAVLVAFLAAALFIGAGAAANEATYNGNTVFVGQVIPDLAGTTWTYGENKVTFNADGYITGPVVEGKYEFNDTVSMNVLYPTVIITAVAEQNGKEYNLAGNTYYKYANITISLKSPATDGGNITDLLITNPDGTKIKLSEVFEDLYPGNGGNAVTIFGSGIQNGQGSDAITPSTPSDKDLIDKLFPVNGEYKIQGIFSNGTLEFAPGILESDLIGKDVFTFKVASSKDVAITATTDSVLEGKRFTVTVTGQPGVQYKLNYDVNEVGIYSSVDATVTADVFTMPNTGSAAITFNAIKDGEITISVEQVSDPTVNAEVVITITPGELTIVADKESYFIGDDIKLSGICTVGSVAGDLKFYIKGTNIPFHAISVNKYSLENGEWAATLKGDTIRTAKLDAGTYTIYVTTEQHNYNLDEQGFKNADPTYATASVNLKQPFISVTEAPSVVVKGADAVIKGTAEAADDLGVYIFGTNTFLYDNESASLISNFVKIELKKDNQFVITIDESLTDELDAGQYFMVIQHPMYDGKLNIWANTTSGNVSYAPTIGANLDLTKATVLFDVDDRQKANAAQALCDELDSQSIDDMYVKLSFVVAAPQSVINPIPAEIAQGEKLTISGSTNLGEGELVTVEMLSTAFAAVPKETVGSAAFISLTTKTDENGNWEVTFDTSGLNVDEYTVTAAVESLDATTAKINVVEAAPEQPDQPDVPGDEPEQPGDEPVAPETPGFGALAALAGLGAVAVLLLRRE